MTQVPELLTVPEVAAALRLSDETIHRWCRTGRLPHIDILGVRRVRRDVVDAIVAGQPLPLDGAGEAGQTDVAL